MKNRSLLFIAAFAVSGVASAFTVTGVSAHQRWPWNSLVDVDFTIGGADANALFKIEVKAAYAGGDRIVEAKTFVTEPVAKAGTSRVTWDFGRDCPNFKADDLRVAVTATPYDNASASIYMVIDLSGGKDATSYPVGYTTQAPAHTPKAEDVCKTTQLWLKRIHPTGTWYMGAKAAPAAGNDSFSYTLTHDYYIGIFETTQQQWYHLTGSWVGDFSNETWRATRPIDTFYPNRLFAVGNKGGWKWPDDKTVLADSALGKFRARTGLATANLPTEAQWQYAADGGATGYDRYLKPDGTVYSVGEIARYSGNAGAAADYRTGLVDADSGTACVGTYAPNAYGLYDMLGNVYEDCLDPYAPVASLKNCYVTNNIAFPLVNPEGLSQAVAKALNSNTSMITIRGSAYSTSSTNTKLQNRSSGRLSYASDSHPSYRGFRFCVTCE